MSQPINRQLTKPLPPPPPSTKPLPPPPPAPTVIGKDQLLPLRLPTPGLFTTSQINTILTCARTSHNPTKPAITRAKTVRERPHVDLRDTKGPQVYWQQELGEWRVYRGPSKGEEEEEEEEQKKSGVWKAVGRVFKREGKK